MLAAAAASEIIPTVIVGRSGLSREGLARIISAGGFKVVGSATRISELLLNSISADQPLMLIIDATGDLKTTAKDIALMKQERPAARIAVLAAGEPNRDVVSLLRAGAHACIAGNATADVFLKSLEVVMLGGTLFPVAILPLILAREEEASRVGLRELDGELPADHIRLQGDDRSPMSKVGNEIARLDDDGIPAKPQRLGDPRLSPQEMRILGQLIEGACNRDIARATGIAEASVKAHVKAILRKIGAANRTQAAVWALHNSSLLETEGTTTAPPLPSP